MVRILRRFRGVTDSDNADQARDADGGDTDTTGLLGLRSSEYQKRGGWGTKTTHTKPSMKMARTAALVDLGILSPRKTQKGSRMTSKSVTMVMLEAVTWNEESMQRVLGSARTAISQLASTGRHCSAATRKMATA